MNHAVSVRLDFYWQEEASVILANLSTILLHVEVNNSEEIVVVAETIVEGASNILEYTYIVNIVFLASAPFISTEGWGN